MSDNISRQAAIDAIGEKSDEIYKTKQKGATYPHDDFFQGMAYAENVVKQLPSAQPKRGKWERHYSRPNVLADLFWHCSECGYKDGENYAPVYHHFCPNCGAKMEVTT